MSLVCLSAVHFFFFIFFFNDTATTEIYTLSLHDALPISRPSIQERYANPHWNRWPRDRKSTRLNSSHGYISYAVFCLKKKKTNPKKQLLVVKKPSYITSAAVLSSV